jgi:hypothetical protein
MLEGLGVVQSIERGRVIHRSLCRLQHISHQQILYFCRKAFLYIDDNTRTAKGYCKARASAEEASLTSRTV